MEKKSFPSNIFLAAAELAGHFMHAVEDGTEPKLILHQVVLGSLEDFVLSQATTGVFMSAQWRKAMSKVNNGVSDA